MSVFVHKHSRVIIQGFTGQHATFHAEESMKNGTTVVAGSRRARAGRNTSGCRFSIPYIRRLQKPGLMSAAFLYRHRLQPMPSWRRWRPVSV